MNLPRVENEHIFRGLTLYPWIYFLAFVTPQECRCWSGTESLWRQRLTRKCRASLVSHVQRRSSAWDCELHLSSFALLSHWNSYMFSCNMVFMHPRTPSLLPPFLSLHSTPPHLTNITLWLITAKLHWLIYHHKFPVWIQTATLICCLTLSTHKPWSTMSSLRLVCTRICWYVCMFACICVHISHTYNIH